MRILKAVNPFCRDKIITNGKKLVKNKILPFGTYELMRVNDGPERKMKENKSSPTSINNVDGLNIAIWHQ